MTALPAVYPRTYDPSYAISCSLLAFIFASAFVLIFPPLAPAVLILLFLTLVGESSHSRVHGNGIANLVATE